MVSFIEYLRGHRSDFKSVTEDIAFIAGHILWHFIWICTVCQITHSQYTKRVYNLYDFSPDASQYDLNHVDWAIPTNNITLKT